MLFPLSFRYVSPELRLYCGEDSLATLMRELGCNGCKRAVVVSGSSVSRSAAMDLLHNILGEVLVGESHAVQSNSPIPAVEEVTRELRGFEADAVIAVGGGSAAVTARAATILLAEEKRQFCALSVGRETPVNRQGDTEDETGARTA